MRRRTYTLEQADASLKRLHSRLYRTVNAIRDWERRKARIANPPEQRKLPASVLAKIAPPPVKPLPYKPLEIPAILDRRQANTADETAKAEILQQQADRKARKRERDRERRAAKRSGEATKIPLQGKAALEYIKG